jgi:hypothetical protein
MQTTFTVTTRDLARLLSLSEHSQDWIMDIIGVPVDTSSVQVDWNELTEDELEAHEDANGLLCFCRDSFYRVLWKTEAFLKSEILDKETRGDPLSKREKKGRVRTPKVAMTIIQTWLRYLKQSE